MLSRCSLATDVVGASDWCSAALISYIFNSRFSSVGRVSALQAEGQWFEPTNRHLSNPHHFGGWINKHGDN